MDKKIMSKNLLIELLDFTSNKTNPTISDHCSFEKKIFKKFLKNLFCPKLTHET